MPEIKPIHPEELKAKLPEFIEKTDAFHEGTVNMKDYKGYSGKFGSYAQRGGKAHMLRLRMTAGVVTPKKLRFVVDAMKNHDLNKMHFTTCQTIQLHDLQPKELYDIMDGALDADIIWYGGGGDFPRNVTCSPLSGTEEEYFDVLPYAKASADFLLGFIDAVKMPRKLKVGFSNNEKNVPHATFRDLGFVAREDGTFDVYGAGGLGNNPRFGVLLDEQVDPKDILYDIEAFINLFCKYGNYENRAKARTRYMQETLQDRLPEEFQKELAAVKAEKNLRLDDLDLHEVNKQPAGEPLEENFQIRAQKQPGLYRVLYHPKGGIPSLEVMDKLAQAMESMEEVEMRLSPDEGSYIVNLTADEARTILEIIQDEAAANKFETSVGCIGAAICQVGLRDSQSALANMLQAVKEAGDIADNALPQVHISGCPSSCGTHQIGKIGFRGGLKVVDKQPIPAFLLSAYGNDREGEERMGREIGMIPETRVSEFIVDLGRQVTQSGLSFDEWVNEHPEGIEQIAASYLI